MRTSTTALAILSLLGLSAAAPTPIELAPRAGTTLFPAFIQQLTEATPSTVNVNTLSSGGDFHVAQTQDPATGAISNRIYQIVAFENIPAGANTCQLNVAFPNPYTITTTGYPTLNVTTLYDNSPSSITYPNNWSWGTFFPPTSPPFGQGLFGTINFAEGQSAVINSEGCPVGGGSLAFVFSIASWVWGSASIEFDQVNGAGLAGVYLTYDP
jgi:hypothetical protein